MRHIILVLTVVAAAATGCGGEEGGDEGGDDLSCGCTQVGDLCGAGLKAGGSPPAGACLMNEGELQCVCPTSREPACHAEC